MSDGRRTLLLAAISTAMLWACGGDDGEPDSGAMEDFGTTADSGPPVDANGGAYCLYDTECDDGLFCNGPERCDPVSPAADVEGCVTGEAPCPDEDEVCLEEAGRCVADGCTAYDADGDGVPSVACGGDDCDDEDAARYPGAAEICDGVDNDCDDTVDPGCDCIDGDSRLCGSDAGACATGIQRCEEGVWGSCTGSVEPEDEICNGVDDDCDGEIDDGVLSSFHLDGDGDEYGDPDNAYQGCVAPEGYVADGTDCDDGSSTVNPGASELCDRLDTNCDAGGGTVPEEDQDEDGHAPEDTSICSDGYPADDCDDTNADIYTGQSRYFADGYCTLRDVPSGACLLYDWDYDCDGESTPQPASTTCVMVGRLCTGSGPIYTGDPPACGSDVDYRSCSLTTMDGLQVCSGTVDTRGMPCR